MHWNGAFLGPFGQGLRQQGQAGHQEQNAFAPAGQGFGDLQAGEGFAGAAGHDELAPVGSLQPRRGRVQRLLLVQSQLLLDFQDRGCLGLVFGPVDLAVLQVVQIDLADGWLLIAKGVFGVGAPVVCGADDDAVGEGLLA